jgi:immune inhibitor A
VTVAPRRSFIPSQSPGQVFSACPPRDPFALAVHYGGMNTYPSITPSPSPVKRTIGDSERFWIPGVGKSHNQVTAKLIYVTPQAYVYLEDGTSVDNKMIQTATDLFETTFSIMIERFYGGKIPSSVNGDQRITFLNSGTMVAGKNGLVQDDDAYPVSIAPFSNERAMVYLHITPDMIDPKTSNYHQSMIYALESLFARYMRAHDPLWFSEGMAVLSQRLIGLEVAGLDDAFFQNTNVSLLGWDWDRNPKESDGAAYLFLNYLVEHYGGYSILQDLMKDPHPVPQNIDSVLFSHGYQDRFDDVYAHWIMANILNDVAHVDREIYSYRSVAHKHVLSGVNLLSYPFSQDGTISQYGVQYFDLRPATGTDQSLQVSFKGDTGVPLIPTNRDTFPFWWSSKGTNSDAILTRTIDLTHRTRQSITLSFDLWYDLTENQDFGYISISTDGGKSWVPQKTTLSRPKDPAGVNYGNGFTGKSTPDTNWIPMQVDLTSYIGKIIQLRFEVITREFNTGQGVAIRSIRIPEIGYMDSGSADAGWSTQGWTYTTNMLPQYYIIQVAYFDVHGILETVQTIPIDETGGFQIPIPHLGSSYSRVILAISPTTRVTSVRSTYHFNVELS